MKDDAQLGLPIEGMGKSRHAESPHAIRIELNTLLERARSSKDSAPWDFATNVRYRALVPERAKALPPEEAEFLRRQFVLEFDRIDLLLAA